MAEHELDPERLTHLVGGAEPAPAGRERVREIDAMRRSRSTAQLVEDALLDIESGRRKRKYSTDERPPDVNIRRSRAGVVVLGLLMVVAMFAWKRVLTPPPPPIPGDPVEVVAVLSPAARVSAPMPFEWSAARSDTGSLGERARAIRIGGLIVELERAAARNDSTAQPFADAIAALVAEVPEGAEVAGLFATVPDARLLSSRHALAPFARAAPMALGAWLQGARVAVAGGDAGFFASQRSRESLRLLLSMAAASPEVAAASDRLQTILHRRGLPDFAAAAGALDVLQRELAN